MKVFGILGAIFFAAAVAVGYFCDFKGDSLVQVALEAFAFASLIIGEVKKAKKEGRLNWKFILSLVFAVIGGILCAVGLVSETIFATIAGAVLGLIAIFAGLLVIKKK